MSSSHPKLRGSKLGVYLFLGFLMTRSLQAGSELTVSVKPSWLSKCNSMLRVGLKKEEQQLLKWIQLIATPSVSSRKKIEAFKKIQGIENPRSYVAVAPAYSELMRNYKDLASEGGENYRTNLPFMETDLPGLTFFYYQTLDTVLERLSKLEKEGSQGADLGLKRAIESYSRVSFFLSRLRKHDYFERGGIISQITGEGFLPHLLDHFYNMVGSFDLRSRETLSLENSKLFSSIFEGLSYLETNHQLSTPPLLAPYRHTGDYVRGVLRSGDTVSAYFFRSFVSEYLLLLERFEGHEPKKAATHLSQLLSMREAQDYEAKLASLKLSGREDPFIRDAVSRLRLQGAPRGEAETEDANFRLNLILFHLNYHRPMSSLAMGLDAEIPLVDF